MPPPLSRPLFLEQDERRLEATGMGSQYVYPYMPPMESHESQELKKGLEELMRENRKLREEGRTA